MIDKKTQISSQFMSRKTKNVCEVIELSKVSIQSKAVKNSSTSAKKMQILCQS